MNDKNKYRAIVLVGGIIICFIVILRNVIPLKLNFFLIGLVCGWFASILLFHSLSDKGEKSKKRKRRSSYESYGEAISLEDLKPYRRRLKQQE